MEEGIMGLAAQIVAAHVARNSLAAEQLPGLIREVYRMLVTVQAGPVTEPKPQPAVAVRKSVAGDHIVCLDCGQSFRMLKRHLLADHSLTTADYRQKWSLPATYPMVAPEYAAERSKLAKASGLGRRPEEMPKKKSKKK